MSKRSSQESTIWRTTDELSIEEQLVNNKTHDPFGNRWEQHPASVENRIKDEPTVKYGLTATEILKKNILLFTMVIWISWKSSWSFLLKNIWITVCLISALVLLFLMKMKGVSLLQDYGIASMIKSTVGKTF